MPDPTKREYTIDQYFDRCLDIRETIERERPELVPYLKQQHPQQDVGNRLLIMPESKHHKKGMSHSQWRKARNKRRARNQEQNALEKRGMRQAMQLMQQQYESEQEALEEKERKEE